MTALRKIRQPTLVTIDDRQTISHGMWNHDLVADYVIANATDKWLDIGDIARFVWRRSTETNRGKARKRIAPLRNHLLDQQRVLLMERNGPHGSISAVKLLDPRSLSDRQMAYAMASKMREKNEIGADRIEKFLQLLPE